MATMINFRAWNQIDSEYINEINAVMSLDGSHIWWDINDSGEMKYEDDPGNYKLEQFTGLKDVNGKDIYEGDILKTKAGLIQIVEQGILEIDREDIINGFYANNLSDEKPHTFSYDDEVIGNVHENPELSEEDK
ncbi:YopX family protein [Lactiplantibacillus plantarum]|uniref:YopX family protein n=1 Tax=Lactiplantibacillus plantarum TaxID=1590 RepID=UPI0013E8E67D|nr:YopX family protein [Lactiplantibacillus plantarum]